jgi:hypothetical protein
MDAHHLGLPRADRFLEILGSSVEELTPRERVAMRTYDRMFGACNQLLGGMSCRVDLMGRFADRSPQNRKSHR